MCFEILGQTRNGAKSGLLIIRDPPSLLANTLAGLHYCETIATVPSFVSISRDIARPPGNAVRLASIRHFSEGLERVLTGLQSWAGRGYELYMHRDGGCQIPFLWQMWSNTRIRTIYND